MHSNYLKTHPNENYIFSETTAYLYIRLSAIIHNVLSIRRENSFQQMFEISTVFFHAFQSPQQTCKLSLQVNCPKSLVSPVSGETHFVVSGSLFEIIKHCAPYVVIQWI